MSLGDQFRLILPPDFKIQAERFGSDSPHVDGDSEQIVQLGGLAKVTLQMSARQPHVQLIEHHAVREPYTAEEFCFGKFEEPYVGSIKDDARRIDITPPDPLLNGVPGEVAHLSCPSNPLRVAARP